MTKSLISQLKSLGFTKVYTKPCDVVINDYWYAKGKTLNECYKTHSSKKQSAFNYCINMCKDLNGKHFAIASKNVNFFTVHFIFEHNGEMYLAYITKAHNYCTPIREYKNTITGEIIVNTKYGTAVHNVY